MLMCIALSDSMLAMPVKPDVAGLMLWAGSSCAELLKTNTVTTYTAQTTKKTWTKDARRGSTARLAFGTTRQPRSSKRAGHMMHKPLSLLLQLWISHVFNIATLEMEMEIDRLTTLHSTSQCIQTLLPLRLLRLLRAASVISGCARICHPRAWQHKTTVGAIRALRKSNNGRRRVRV